jgi:hypothetical protein
MVFVACGLDSPTRAAISCVAVGTIAEHDPLRQSASLLFKDVVFRPDGADAIFPICWQDNSEMLMDNGGM